MHNDSSKCKECLPNYYIEDNACKLANYDVLEYLEDWVGVLGSFVFFMLF